MRRSSKACMVRRYPDSRANLQIIERKKICTRHATWLLTHPLDNAVTEVRTAVDTPHLAESHVVLGNLRAPVLRQRETAGIHQKAILLDLPSDHGRENGERDVLLVARFDFSLEHILEHVDTRPRFRNSVEILCMRHRRRRSDRYHLALETRRTQTLGT